MRLILFLLAIFLGSLGSIANPAYADQHADDAVQRLQRYIQIDTTNPPGNESAGVDFLGQLLSEAGIAYETAESAPGRGNLWARLEGGSKPGLILLHHIDVVPANADYWDHPPLSGAIKDGFIHGRGAVDTKGLGIAQLQAFIALKESGRRLNRDVIYMATADEEAGGFYGAGWLLEHRPEIFKGVGFLINEGGSARLFGTTPAFHIEVTQKVPLWLRLTATDEPGHGSSPRLTSAVTRILQAGHRIATTRFARRLVPAVRDYFHAAARFQDSELGARMADMDSAIQDEAFMLNLQLEQPGLAALTGNTCSLTRLKGSGKINVVPPTAELELDCRLLPDQSPDAFLADLETIIADPHIEISRIMGFTPSVSSTDTQLYKAIGRTVAKRLENAVLVPSVSTGFTDSHFFRDAGIVSYGFSPFMFVPGEATGVHGNNERLSLDNLRSGTEILTDLLMEFTVR